MCQNPNIPSTSQLLVSMLHSSPQSCQLLLRLYSLILGTDNPVHSQGIWGNFTLTPSDSFLPYRSHVQIRPASSAPNSDFCLLCSVGQLHSFGLHFIAHWQEFVPRERTALNGDWPSACPCSLSLKDKDLALAVFRYCKTLDTFICMCVCLYTHTHTHALVCLIFHHLPREG